jgi:hypothetical protein
VLLGLGFTFFSGATEAWLVDGLRATGYQGPLDAAFARGQLATGAGMLTGTLAGGVIAQATNLGVPYLLRAATLALTFAVAFGWMRDVGFTPRRVGSYRAELAAVFRASIDDGLRRPPVRWMMLAGVFASGVLVYAFYAVQPWLLELRGRNDYALAGLAASLAAAAQVASAFLVPHARRLFRRRTSALLAEVVASAVALVAMAAATRVWMVFAVLAAWSLLFFAAQPLRQAYLNELIPSEQRATVLSSDNLLGSFGGALAQPGLGRVAERWGYPASFAVTAALQLLAVPFLVLARRTRAPSDPIPGAPAREGHAAPQPLGR